MTKHHATTDGTGNDTGLLGKLSRLRTATTYFLPSAARSIAVFSSGSPSTDLTDEWNSLTKVKKSFFVFIPCVMALAAGTLLLLLFMKFPGGTILLYARSEYLEYTPITDDPPRWVLPTSSKLHWNKQPLSSDDSFQGGYLEINCGDKLTVSRIGMGSLLLNVDIADKNQLGILDTSDEYLQEIESKGGNLVVEIPEPEKLQKQGASLSWPMTGLITPGRPVKYEAGVNRGLLLDGRLQVISQYLGSDHHYLVEEITLELGDQIVLATSEEYAERIAELRKNSKATGSDFECIRGEATDKGFINFDGNPGFNLALSSESDTGNIVRYNTTPIRVGSSVIKRILNDKWYSLAWTFVFLFFATYRKFVRSYLARNQLELDDPSKESEK